MSARETAELLLLLGRFVQAEAYHGNLSPAHWMALRFFARANSFSRTPSAFAEFQATTRGTATQTIKALEAGEYLVRQQSEADGRSVSLRLTSKGKKALALTRTSNGSRASVFFPLLVSRRLTLRPSASDRRRTKYPPASSALMACDAVPRVVA